MQRHRNPIERVLRLSESLYRLHGIAHSFLKPGSSMFEEFQRRGGTIAQTEGPPPGVELKIVHSEIDVFGALHLLRRGFEVVPGQSDSAGYRTGFLGDFCYRQIWKPQPQNHRRIGYRTFSQRLLGNLVAGVPELQRGIFSVAVRIGAVEALDDNTIWGNAFVTPFLSFKTARSLANGCREAWIYELNSRAERVLELHPEAALSVPEWNINFSSIGNLNRFGCSFHPSQLLMTSTPTVRTGLNIALWASAGTQVIAICWHPNYWDEVAVGRLQSAWSQTLARYDEQSLGGNA